MSCILMAGKQFILLPWGGVYSEFHAKQLKLYISLCGHFYIPLSYYQREHIPVQKSVKTHELQSYCFCVSKNWSFSCLTLFLPGIHHSFLNGFRSNAMMIPNLIAAVWRGKKVFYSILICLFQTIIKAIYSNQVVVLSGETGCGKTTQVKLIHILPQCFLYFTTCW